MSDMNLPIQVEGLSITYGQSPVIQDVSLRVEPGQIYALLGRNGVGKSSLVRCLLGQQRPQAGGIWIFGMDAWKQRAQIMARVGVMFEEPLLPLNLTVGELVRFCASLYPNWLQADVLERLRRFGISQDKGAGQLSRGQKAQLSFALAMGSAPELLVLDDPTLGLDAVAKRTLYGELVGELADRGTSVLLSSHDLTGVEGLADAIGILRQSCLLLSESLESLKTRFRRIRISNSSEGEEAVRTRFSVLDPISLQLTAWGVELCVAQFDEARLGGLGEIQAVESLSLEELFITLAPSEEVLA